MTWPRGSEWRRWDLHVHSPASHGFSGNWRDFIIQIGNSDCSVIGINDYFSIRGYTRVRQELTKRPEETAADEAYAMALENLRSKYLMPVIECRMSNILLDKSQTSGVRLNFHLIFDPDLAICEIELFLKGLPCGGAQIGSRYDDSKFLLNDVSVRFDDTIARLKGDKTFAGRFLVWLPYDEHGGIDNIDPMNDKYLKQRLIEGADIIGSSNKKQIDFFHWKNTSFSEDQYKEWFKTKKPCIKGSDSHKVSDIVGRLKDKDSKPVDKYCWIKADPTFMGLRQITIEPEDRVHIGKLPPQLDTLSSNPAQYLTNIHIKKVSSDSSSDVWFDCSLPLNSGMVAIIGNKGTGKSALADILALSGNAHCDSSFYSFLTPHRFCDRNGRTAKLFAAEAVWADESTTHKLLNDRPAINEVERIKYIPQTFLERVCGETDPGKRSEFQQELRKVIFSHITEAGRLGKESLDELIFYKTEEIAIQRKALVEELSGRNAEIIKLESKRSDGYREQLQSGLDLKRAEQETHYENRPKEVGPPTDLSGEEKELYSRLEALLSQEKSNLSFIDERISAAQVELIHTTENVAIADKLRLKLSSFHSTFQALEQTCQTDLTKLSVDFGDIISFSIDLTPLDNARSQQFEKQQQLERDLDPANANGLSNKRLIHLEAIKDLTAQLNIPSQQYHEYQEALASWNKKRDSIVGDATTTGSLKWYESQIAYVSLELPKLIETLKIERETIARRIHETIVTIRDEYRNLFKSVQTLIEESSIVKEGFKLSFDSTIADQGFQDKFFATFLNQGVAGSFCGKEQGAAFLEQIGSEFTFNDTNEAVAFVNKVELTLHKDFRSDNQKPVNIAGQLRKNVTVLDFYNYLWGFSYLEPEYSLQLDGKELSYLSPGERGTLLLVFYLLADKSRCPIIVDQPEENLDSHTIYRQLIPVFKEAKKRRQIIMITHSPNIAVVCDAEQIIHAHIERTNGHRVVYSSGSIESATMNKYLVDVLEGTRPAFDNRQSKYYIK